MKAHVRITVLRLTLLPLIYWSLLVNYQEPASSIFDNQKGAYTLTRSNNLYFCRLIEYRCTSYPVRRTEALSACFNSTGTRIFSLYKSLPPCVFDTFSEKVQFYCVDDEAWFDIKVTLKSGCFAGSSDEVGKTF